ncbi:DUF6118 family protein, partial [Enterobacter roggenkampii]|uniref:DUF6118 family protein n=1 Tax=Enterobacter roggenkampii TaxID=1812935 RepID=UPI0020043159
ITSPWKWRHLKSVIVPSVQSPPSMLKLHDFCNRARWNAGVTMMRVADPRSWRGVADSSQLVRDNAEAIGQCAEAARTAGSDQQCTITVKAPAAPAQ